MNERGAAHDALVRVVAVDDAVDRAQHRVADRARSRCVPPRAAAPCGWISLTRASGSGCVSSQFGTPLRLPRRFVEPSERREHVGHAGRIPVARATRTARRADRPAARTSRLYFRKRTPRPCSASWPNGRAPGTKMPSATSRPSRRPQRVYCCAACRAVTWPVSWPSTPASCASSLRNGRMPRVM